VVVAPVGFLADHVEILYDLDIEARAWASELSLQFSRTASLNADDVLVDVLVDVARGLTAPPAPPPRPGRGSLAFQRRCASRAS
jgi:protoheme ferro-lyase